MVPDISANADEYTPYSEYCTGTDPSSVCGYINSTYGLEWFGIGGTSLSSPLWAGITADWDSYHGTRLGNANVALYSLYNTNSRYLTYFHDITGKNQTENNNGYYYTTPNYDLATGIGVPNITGYVESRPAERYP
jgi:subtilase family serine protease